jgi:hypothetical protein
VIHYEQTIIAQGGLTYITLIIRMALFKKLKIIKIHHVLCINGV